MRKKRCINNIIGTIVFIILLLLDRITKIIAVVTLKNQPSVPIVKNVFILQYLENHGAAFGILQGKQSFLLIVTIVALVVIAFLYYKLPLRKKYIILRFLLLAIGAGAIGNLIDRFLQGYVVDFLYFCLINFPIFNVADIYVTLGAIILIILVLFFYKDEDFKEIKTHLKRRR